MESPHKYNPGDFQLTNFGKITITFLLYTRVSQSQIKSIIIVKSDNPLQRTHQLDPWVSGSQSPIMSPEAPPSIGQRFDFKSYY